MKALIIISILGVIAMMAEVLRYKKLLVPIIVAGLFIALATVVMDWNTDIRYFNDMAYFNNYALAFTGAIIFITLLWMLLGQEYFKDTHTKGEHAALILFCLAGAIAMISFSDLTLFFIGLEILSISLYVLAASNKNDLRSNEAGLKYFLMGAFATGFLLFGIALIYGATATFNLQGIQAALAKGAISPLMVKTGVLLILVGLLFKVSAAPFHFWAPDVYEGAPTLVTMFMATVVKTAAFAAFYRLFSTCFISLADTWIPVVAVLSAITMLLGNIMAVFQSSFKRMLAYSSIAHAGYMMMAIAAMNEVSAGSIFLYAIAYSIGSLGAFACLHAMSSNGDESISGLNGLGNRQPKVAIFLSLIMFSLAGIPPVAGFFAKYYLFYGALMGGYTWLVLIAVLSSLIGVYYYFRVIFALFKTSPVSPEELPRLLPKHYILLVLSAIISLGIGLSPAWLQSLIS